MTGVCDTLVESESQGVAPALRAVDCLSTQTASDAFGRLFGGQGALLPALTIVLTLYIAVFALSLLTGRSRIGISALTPRMMTLGVVLTFATSWVAYQGVVWNLALGGPDQIAAVLTGAKGSATQIFADRIDLIFNAIAEVAQQTDGGSPSQAAATSAFTPAGAMWLGAVLLLLGTAGVLVAARIALAVLLAVGPVFVIFALFPGTRGLCAGWLRGVAMTAVTPLFVVTGGSLTVELLVPVVNALRNADAIGGRAALALFVIAAIHGALIALVLKVSGTMVASWNVFGLSDPARTATSGAGLAQMAPANGACAPATAASPSPGSRASSVSAAMLAQISTARLAEPGAPSSSPARVAGIAMPNASAAPLSQQRHRARGIGSRFQPAGARSLPSSRPTEFRR